MYTSPHLHILLADQCVVRKNQLYAKSNKKIINHLIWDRIIARNRRSCMCIFTILLEPLQKETNLLWANTDVINYVCLYNNYEPLQSYDAWAINATYINRHSFPIAILH